jgi:hypothetical protein
MELRPSGRSFDLITGTHPSKRGPSGPRERWSVHSRNRLRATPWSPQTWSREGAQGVCFGGPGRQPHAMDRCTVSMHPSGSIDTEHEPNGTCLCTHGPPSRTGFQHEGTAPAPRKRRGVFELECLGPLDHFDARGAARGLGPGATTATDSPLGASRSDEPRHGEPDGGERTTRVDRRPRPRTRLALLEGRREHPTGFRRQSAGAPGERQQDAPRKP